jgi:hypothetical protein
MPNPMNFFNINPPLSNHVGTVCYTLKSLFPAPRADFRAHPHVRGGVRADVESKQICPCGISATLSPACTIEQIIFAISQDRPACAT